MIETSVAGTPFEVRDLDEEWLLDAAREAEVQARMAERRKVRLAAQWCVLHEIPAGSENAATWADDPGGMGCLAGRRPGHRAAGAGPGRGHLGRR